MYINFLSKYMYIRSAHSYVFIDAIFIVCSEKTVGRSLKYWIRELNHHMQCKILQLRGCWLSVNQIRSISDPTTIDDSKKFTPFSSSPHLCCELYKLLRVQLFPACLGHERKRKE